MESCSNQKSGSKQIKIYFRFFKVATRCLDDSFAHSWHYLNYLKNLKYKISFDITLFWLPHDSRCVIS
jgi:hypothetical protein